MTERSNYQWVHDLNQNGSMRLQAIRDLGEFLERGLYHYLTHRRNDLADHSGDELRQIAQKYAGESLNRVLESLAAFEGTSQFTTWAGKFAARVATTRLKYTNTVQTEGNEMARRTADQENEGSFVVPDEAVNIN